MHLYLIYWDKISQYIWNVSLSQLFSNNRQEGLKEPGLNFNFAHLREVSYPFSTLVSLLQKWIKLFSPDKMTMIAWHRMDKSTLFSKNWEHLEFLPWKHVAIFPEVKNHSFYLGGCNWISIISKLNTDNFKITSWVI